MVKEKIRKLTEELRNTMKRIEDLSQPVTIGSPSPTNTTLTLVELTTALEFKLDAYLDFLEILREKISLVEEMLGEVGKFSEIDIKKKEIALAIIKSDHKGKVSSDIKTRAKNISKEELVQDLKSSLQRMKTEEKSLEQKVMEIKKDLDIELAKEKNQREVTSRNAIQAKIAAKEGLQEERFVRVKEFEREIEKADILLSEYDLAQDELKNEEKISELRRMLS
ncbi:MAG: hypothetical protein WDA09_11055 [Bacteriovoracaceae bacterium]